MNKGFIIAGFSVLSTLPNYEIDIHNGIYMNNPISRDTIGSCLSSYYNEAFDGVVSNCDLCDRNEQPYLGILSDEKYIKDDIIKQDVMAKLNLLQNLDEDWDGYGAPKISITAINNCQLIINKLTLDIIQNVNVSPSEFGSVQLEMEKDNGIVNCDFGDDTFSYYVEKKDAKTEYYSFLEYTEKNVQQLINYFSLMSNV